MKISPLTVLLGIGLAAGAAYWYFSSRAGEANISSMTVSKRPGTDNVTAAVTINYTGNVSKELKTTISLADSSNNVLANGLIKQDTSTYAIGQSKPITGTVVMPSGLASGLYNAVCTVQRNDTGAVIAEAHITAAVEVLVRKIYGYVKNSSGNPIGGAAVTVTGYPLLGKTTGPDGYYEITGLPETSGFLDINVTALGMVPQTKSVAIPGPGEQTQQDFSMVSEIVTATITNFSIT